MINLRSSLSALALVGAVFGFSSVAHATTAPALAVYDGVTLSASDPLNNQAGVTVTDSFIGRGKVSVNVDANTGASQTNIIGQNTQFAGAVEFTLADGNAVTWSGYGATPPVSKVEYELVAGFPAAKGTDYESSSYPSLAVTTDPSTGTLTWSGLAAGDYSLIIEGTTSAYATVSGTLSAVPLPGSLVMFGSALLGLTAFGARRRSSFSA